MKSRGQSTLEIAVLTAVMVAALIAALIYLKRSFQGRYRDLADSVGEQYEPRGTTITGRSTHTTTWTHSVSNRVWDPIWVWTEIGSSFFGIGRDLPRLAVSSSGQEYTTFTETGREVTNVPEYPTSP